MYKMVIQAKASKWKLIDRCIGVKPKLNVLFVNLSLGARGLHAPHPDGRPKAGKTSGLHGANEVSEVLVASDLWFQPSKTSLSCYCDVSLVTTNFSI